MVSKASVVICTLRLCQFNPYVEQYSSGYQMTLHHPAILIHNHILLLVFTHEQLEWH